jgi:photosystem I P700 chlorophyll a apoprotein A1
VFYRFVNSRVWSKPQHFNNALSKGPLSTTWIWNLHSDAHDFDIQQGSQSIVARKVFSSNIAHLSTVFFWLGGMHFHGAYFANYDAWLKDPKHSLPSAHNVWPLVGQDILNSDVGGWSYLQGIYVTSGFFQLWRSEGLMTQVHLKYACCASLIGTIVSCSGSYYHMHVKWSTVSFNKKFKSLSTHHSAVLFGLGSISWCGHQIHISVPLNLMLDSGIDPVVMPCPQDLLSLDLMRSEMAFFGFGVGPSDYSKILGFAGKLLHPSTGSVFLGQVAAHHFYVGVVFIMGSILGISFSEKISRAAAPLANSWHAQLSINLAVTGSFSIAFAHIVYAIPVYPYSASDYPTLLCLFCHHIMIGGLFIIGAGAHASILMVRDMNLAKYSCNSFILLQILNHRDVILAHLIWVTVALGLHSFGLYIHNDTLQALGRPEDTFSDNSIQLKPVLAAWVLSTRIVSFDIEVLDGKVIRMTQELGTADFMVHHIHAFTIHTTLLILSKGVLYARSSRLVHDKLELGFRYPCDGPGRGGTCQISPWDHIYLAVFWMYNSLSVVLFHYFWKMQSDCWGVYDVSSQKIMHISGGDFSVNSGSINGWLRDLLWSQAAQVIQSYGTSISGYGLIFIGAHFVWAFSLMFLYSGRGYWQELIESIIWAHQKFKIVPYIQPRALSISQGRAVGLTHYVLGGIGCTWAFVISRMIVV